MAKNKKLQLFLTRLKNPSIIAALGSIIALILLNTHKISVIVSNSINQSIETLLTLLIGFGIMSNPDKPKRKRRRRTRKSVERNITSPLSVSGGKLMDKKVEEHNETIHLTVVEHYEQHEKREESALFRQTKKHMQDNHVGCFINNGKCEGNIEIHHGIIEWSAATEVDWEKIKLDYPNFTNVDQEVQMMGLCEKHHRHAGFGIHTIPYPIWILQKYMTKEALDDFEKAVKEQLNKGVVKDVTIDSK